MSHKKKKKKNFAIFTSFVMRREVPGKDDVYTLLENVWLASDRRGVVGSTKTPRDQSE